MDGYGYQGGYETPFAPIMPQADGLAMPGMPWQPSQAQPQAMPAPQPTSGPLADGGEEGGFPVPSRLGVGSSVPVTRCPDGRWASCFATGDGELQIVIYVLMQDGTYAPYRIEGVGALRLALDATPGAESLSCTAPSSGRPVHVLHLAPRPAEGTAATEGDGLR